MAEFRAKINLDGKTATGIIVPENVVSNLNGGKRAPVSVTLNGYTYKSTIASMGGVYMLPVSAAVREAAGVQAGDDVVVSLQLDTAPREVDLPTDFAKALNGDKAAQEFFESLSNSRKKAFTYWIETAKQAETRQRRVEQSVDMLHNKQMK